MCAMAMTVGRSFIFAILRFVCNFLGHFGLFDRSHVQIDGIPISD